jgi:protein ImuB
MCSPPLPLETAVTATTGALLRFQWSGLVHQVRCLWGPERIATGWWRGEDVQRDYYIVETATGSRFWVFRRRQDDRWLLHGWFD